MLPKHSLYFHFQAIPARTVKILNNNEDLLLHFRFDVLNNNSKKLNEPSIFLLFCIIPDIH